MLLFTPGPTPVSQNVRNAMFNEIMHHRTPKFEAIFEKTRKHLFNLFNTDEVVMLSSSGTGAMEASVINLCHNTFVNVEAVVDKLGCRKYGGTPNKIFNEKFFLEVENR